MEALIWLRSQDGERVIGSAAKLGRLWGWNRMRASRRLKAWEQAGLIRRDAEAIIVTEPETPTVKEDPLAVTEATAVTVTSGAKGARGPTTLVSHAAFVAALALACVSAAFSIDA
jgi:hypothetical protein